MLKTGFVNFFVLMLLTSLPRGFPGEGPDCQFPEEIGGFGRFRPGSGGNVFCYVYFGPIRSWDCLWVPGRQPGTNAETNHKAISWLIPDPSQKLKWKMTDELTVSLRIRQEIFDFEPALGLRLGQTKPNISGAAERFWPDFALCRRRSETF